MKKRKIKEDPAVRDGQEFLDAFKEIPYSTDRIGQIFVMHASYKGLKQLSKSEDSI